MLNIGLTFSSSAGASCSLAESSPHHGMLREWAATLTEKSENGPLCSTLNTQPEGNGAAQQDHRLGDEAAAAFQPLGNEFVTLDLHGWPREKHMLNPNLFSHEFWFPLLPALPSVRAVIPLGSGLIFLCAG